MTKTLGRVSLVFPDRVWAENTEVVAGLLLIPARAARCYCKRAVAHHSLKQSHSMSKLVTPRDLLVQELKDLHSVETQLLKALPRMIKGASHPELRNVFSRHLEETREHVHRIEMIATRLDESVRGKRSRAMEGLIEEARDVLESDAASEIKDLALIAAAQKVEHYEIAGYGCARTLADLIGESELADILQETLDEEGTADKLLTEVAMSINVEVGGLSVE